MIDSHIHTHLCKHSSGNLEKYIEEAIAKKFRVIGFSEHAPFILDHEDRMNMEETEGYLQELVKLKNKYSAHLKILTGLEIDYSTHAENFVRDMIKRFDCDFLLGAVHFIEIDSTTLSLWDYELMQSAQARQKYFVELGKAISSNLFDAIAHPDLILMTGIPKKEINHNLKLTVELCRKHKIAYEINCAGLSKGSYNPLTSQVEKDKPGYPNLDLALFAYQKGVPLVIGSDAHALDKLGHNISGVIDILKEKGVNRINYFEKRKIKEITI